MADEVLRYDYNLDDGYGHHGDYTYDYSDMNMTELPVRELTKLDLVQLSAHTVLTGVLCALVFLSLVNIYAKIKSQTFNIPPTLFLFYEFTAIVIALVAVLALIEYFLLYDFYFHQSIEWKVHHQWLSFLIDFARLMQKSLILALGFHHYLTFGQCGYCASTGTIFKRCFLPWFLFAFNSLSLPLAAVAFGIDMKLVSLTKMVESTLLPILFGFILYLMLYIRAKKRFHSELVCQKEEILSTKAVLLFILALIISGIMEGVFFDIVPLLFRHYIMQILEFVQMLLSDFQLISVPSLYLYFFGDHAAVGTAHILSGINSKNVVEPQQISIDASHVVIGSNVAVVDSQPAPAADASPEASAAASSAATAAYFRRLFPTGPISYNVLNESQQSDLNNLIDVRLDEVESRR